MNPIRPRSASSFVSRIACTLLAIAAALTAFPSQHFHSDPATNEFFNAVFDARLETVGSMIASSPRLATAENNERQTPLYYCGDEATANALINAGADVSHVDSMGMTPLNWNTLGGRLGAVKALLAHGADIEARDPAGLTALDHAARAGQGEVLGYLFTEGASGAESVLAVLKGDESGVRQLLGEAGTTAGLTKESLLFVATYSGRIEIAKLLLDAGVSPDSRNYMDQTPLHVAAGSGNIPMAELLLAHGAHIDARDKEFNSPLRTAAHRNDTRMMELLLANWADINELNATRDSWGLSIVGKTLLDDALIRNDASLAEFLLAHGASPNNSEWFDSPLLEATRMGNADIVDSLARHGADISIPDADTRTPLELAVDRGDVTVATVLIKHGAAVNRPGPDGLRPMDRAQKAGNRAMAELLDASGGFGESRLESLFARIRRMETTADLLMGPMAVTLELSSRKELLNATYEGNTPLTAAIRIGNFLMVDAILEARPDPNLPDGSGLMPLFMLAAMNDETALAQMTRLIELGANVNALNGPTKTPMLAAAAITNNLPAARLLIGKGANARLQDSNGDTVVALALSRVKEPVGEMISVLASAGADLNARNSLGLTPLFFCMLNGRRDEAATLLANGANPDLPGVASDRETLPLHAAVASERVEFVQMLIQAKAGVNVPGYNGLTPLHFAAGLPNTTILGMLIDARPDLNKRDSNSNAPLHLAVREGRIEAVRMLLKAGADVNQRGQHSYTPLHVAVIEHQFEIARLLLDSGAHVNAGDNRGRTPLDFAKDWQMQDLLRSRNGETSRP